MSYTVDSKVMTVGKRKGMIIASIIMLTVAIIIAVAGLIFVLVWKKDSDFERVSPTFEILKPATKSSNKIICCVAGSILIAVGVGVILFVSK